MQIIKKRNTEKLYLRVPRNPRCFVAQDLESFYILAWSGIEETLEFLTSSNIKHNSTHMCVYISNWNILAPLLSAPHS